MPRNIDQSSEQQHFFTLVDCLVGVHVLCVGMACGNTEYGRGEINAVKKMVIVSGVFCCPKC